MKSWQGAPTTSATAWAAAPLGMRCSSAHGAAVTADHLLAILVSTLPSCAAAAGCLRYIELLTPPVHLELFERGVYSLDTTVFKSV